MKKILIIVIIFATLILSSCKSERPINPDTVYSSCNMKLFLNDLLQAQSEQNIYDPLYVENERNVTIPCIVSSDYVFHNVEVNIDNFIYYYIPIGYSGNYLDDSIITVVVNRIDGSYKAVLDNRDLIDQNGAVFVAEDNCWFVNNNGKYIYIKFPEEMKINSYEELSSYFEFVKQNEFVFE